MQVFIQANLLFIRYHKGGNCEEGEMSRSCQKIPGCLAQSSQRTQRNEYHDLPAPRVLRSVSHAPRAKSPLYSQRPPRALRETFLSEYSDSSRRVHRERRELNIQPCPLRGFSNLYPARRTPNPLCTLSGLCVLCARHPYLNIQIPRAEFTESTEK